MSAIPGSSAFSPAHRDPGLIHRLAVRPPGWPMHAVAAIAMLGLIDAVSVPGAFVLNFLAFALLWFALLLIWLTRVGFFLYFNARHDPATTTRRGAWNWYVGPVLAAITLALVMQEVPVRLRFAMSRSALAQLAEQAAKAGPKDLDWFKSPVRRAGAFKVEIVQVTSTGEVDFRVAGTEFFRSFGGFTYSPAGAPYDPEGSHEPLGGDWYVWHTSW